MDNGIGVSVKQKDIFNIKKVIDNVDYGKLKENICTFQNKFCIENKAQELIKILSHI
jgi:hypothetical protein